MFSSIMPKKKSNKGNTKDSDLESGGGGSAAAAVASLPTTSRPIPSVESLLPISEVMEDMKACGKGRGKYMVEDMLNAAQWLRKSVKNHNTYYRYVIKNGEVQPQTVTHSCTSGKTADLNRAGDLKRLEYTDVQYVISSKVVKGDPSLYPP